MVSLSDALHSSFERTEAPQKPPPAVKPIVPAPAPVAKAQAQAAPEKPKAARQVKETATAKPAGGSPVMAALWKEAAAKKIKGYQKMRRSDLEKALA